MLAAIGQLPIVVDDIVGGRIARSRNAFVSAYPGMRPLTTRALGLGLVAYAVVGALILAVVQILLDPLTRWTAWFANALEIPFVLAAVTLTAIPILILVAPMLIDGLTLAGALVQARGATAAVVDELDGAVPVLTVTGFVAWPPRRGHGSALLAEVMRALPEDVTVVAAAADPALAQVYERRAGLTPVTPGSLVLIRRGTCYG